MADIKSEYELNVDFWFYHKVEYHRGDLVPIPDDLDEDGIAHVKQLVEAGSLVEPGFTQRLRGEQAQAEADAEKRRLEQIAFDDAEANRVTAAEQRRLHGDPKPVSVPKPGPRRSSGSK